MGSGRPPGISLTVNEGEAVVSDVVAAVFVYGGGVGWLRDAEGVAADDAQVWDGNGTRDERELVFGDRAARLEKSPSADSGLTEGYSCSGSGWTPTACSIGMASFASSIAINHLDCRMFDCGW